jgi:hypothetical protein
MRHISDGPCIEADGDKAQNGNELWQETKHSPDREGPGAGVEIGLV